MTEVTFDSKMHVALVDWMGGDLRAVQAARVSTKGANTPEEGGDQLVRFLMVEKHEVPFEHSVFTFLIEAPIFVTRQILKHRITSISETSGRYRELQPKFYVMPDDRPVVQVGKTGAYNFVEDPEALAFQQESQREFAQIAWGVYQSRLARGIAKEAARDCLPPQIYSSMYLTINARSLMNFLELRNEHHAQFEIREVAKLVEDEFKELMPTTYNAWRTRD